ncbi:MAG: hypothetical protein ACKVOW_19605, partial [Chitinophagaceae bacterium]
MKARIFPLSDSVFVGKLKQLIPITLMFFSSMLIGHSGKSQCGVGYTAAQMNWDNLDYLINTGNYNPYVSAALAYSQNFTLGTVRTTFAVSNSITLGGENATHTGELLNYTGDDVQFTPTVGFVAITITFETEVTNANFTLYDIDRNAIFGLSATNAASVAQNIGVLTQLGTILAVGGTITNPTITAGNSSSANNSNNGSVTISVVGPVKTIIIAIANPGTDPIFWLSDINGGVTGSFPNAYYNVSQPF